MAKVITVFGATGSQGGSVVRTFTHDPKLKSEWTVRAVTRDATSDGAQKLAAEGIEVVIADANNKKSLLEAMKGSTAVFSMTTTGNTDWGQSDIELELQQGKNLADAAKEAGVAQYIWSSLPYVQKLTNGTLTYVYNFDTKARIEEYVRSIGIPAAFFLPGSFMTNYSARLLQPSPAHDGAYAIALPFGADRPIALFDTADTGKFVKAIIRHWNDVVGKHILGTSGDVTGDEIITTFKRAFPEAGKGAGWHELDYDSWGSFVQGPGLMKETMIDNMKLIAEYGYFVGESYELTQRILEDDLTSWEQHIRKSPAYKGLK
ncbi:hscarg protein [Colletotrichum truncatum]|uniref:Hscarg protein n=1 Tax=Colletotrichum truncatum TaxID=5467 RepID=A0ACC3YD55_COLTU|nr:hscarg protein [Colletotrichum truncatum]KAF6784804.1 hscarg protein [Colletotrichum truncatum]